MKTFEFYFHARKKGAIGLGSMYRAERTAENEEAAKLALYDEYDHISFARINEKQENGNG